MLLDERLTALAPDPAESGERVAALRGDVLDRALDQTHVQAHAQARAQALRSASRGRARRRWAISGLAAATVAAALVVGPTLLPSHDGMPPNPLTPLAQAAARSGMPALDRGQVLHRVVRATQVGGDGKVQIDARYDYWTLADGRSYERRTDFRPEIAPKYRVVTTYEDVVGGGDLTPAEIAKLPTEPEALLEAIGRSRQAGNAPGLDLRRDLLLQILYKGYAPSKVWAAAIEALGSFPEVKVDTSEVGLTTVSFWMDSKEGTDAMTFRDSDGALVAQRATTTQDGGATYTAEVPVNEILDAVPAGVRAAALRDGQERPQD